MSEADGSMLIFIAEEQSFAEENAESNTATLRFLCENSAVSAIKNLPELAHEPN